MGITQFLITYITAFIDKSGYISIGILMTLESMIAPVPSEAVMPFAGFLISDGRFTFAGVIFISTLGSIIGSLLSYAIGDYGGRPLIDKYGKYLFLNHHHLEMTEKFFKKYGDVTILVSRFIPVVRHLISIPAGAGKMNIFKFSLYTIIGAGIWNSFLTYVGYVLRQNWEEIIKYSEVIDKIVLLLFFIVFIYILYKYFKKRLSFKKR